MNGSLGTDTHTDKRTHTNTHTHARGYLPRKGHRMTIQGNSVKHYFGLFDVFSDCMLESSLIDWCPINV